MLNDYCVRWHPSAGSRLKLFCLPHAGGGASTFRQWSRLLQPDVDLVAIRLPGRETRAADPAFREIDPLVDAVVRSVAGELDQPYAWLGHSLGAAIAYRICTATARLRLRPPESLFVVSAPAPHFATSPPPSDVPRDALIEHLKGLGGTADEILANKWMMNTILPILRSDFAVAETIAYRDEPPLEHPIHVYSGLDDPLVDVGLLKEWRQHSIEEVKVRLFGGGHFFLHEKPDLLPVLRGHLESLRGLVA